MRSAVLLLLVAACGKSAAPVPGTAPLAAKAYFRVDAAKPLPASCKVGAACEIDLVITALDGFHVNAEYPTKFVRTGGEAIAKFTANGEDRGTLTVTITPAAGTTSVAGVVKLSVCSGDRCEIEAPEITVPVAVSNG